MSHDVLLGYISDFCANLQQLITLLLKLDRGVQVYYKMMHHFVFSKCPTRYLQDYIQPSSLLVTPTTQLICPQCKTH